MTGTVLPAHVRTQTTGYDWAIRVLLVACVLVGWAVLVLTLLAAAVRTGEAVPAPSAPSAPIGFVAA